MDIQKSGAKMPKLLKENPLAAAAISKLNTSKEMKNIDPLSLNLPTIAMSTRDRIKSNEDIVQLFPDTELCIQILTSSVLCPNDILTTSLLYDLKKLRLPSELKQSILNTIRDYINNTYNLEDKLSTILRESLFTKGSYIEAIIPESSLDDLIHQRVKGVSNYDNITNTIAQESFLRNINPKPNYKHLFLGEDDANVTVGTEEFKITSELKPNVKHEVIEITEADLGISITEDLTLLNLGREKLNTIHKTIKEEIYGKTVAREEELDSALDNIFKQAEVYDKLEGLQLHVKEDASRQSLGKPLVMKLPVESVIPVHVVNDPSKHLGYFILLDKYGSPVDNNTGIENNGDTIVNSTREMDTKLNLINKASAALNGITKEDPILDNIEDVYNKLVEDMIKKKLAKGLYGDIVEIKDNADVYRVMFNRALRSMETRLVFIPSEMVMFYAFDFRDNGTGKSLLEKAALLYSIRSILLFTRLMATLKNSVTITNVNVTLDEFIPDPQAAMEKIISETLKTRQTQMPVGVTKVNDVVDWIHKVGYRFNFKHPGLPDMEIQTDETGANKIIPDEDLDLKIRENIIMSFGLTPEIVDSGYSADFATTVVAKNLLFAKRVTNIQNMFTPLVTEHVKKLLFNDAGIMGIITSLIESNTKVIRDLYKKLEKKKSEDFTEEESELSKVKDSELTEYLANRIVKDLEITLPEPSLNEADAMKMAYETYKQTVGDYIEELVSSESLPEELAGELGGKIDIVKPILKNVMLRKWMMENKYLTELADFVTKDEEGKPLFPAMQDYADWLSNLADAVGSSYKKILKERPKRDKKLAKDFEMPEEEENSEEETGEDNGNNDNGGAGIDGGGGFGAGAGDSGENGESDTEGTEENTDSDTGGGIDGGGGFGAGADTSDTTTSEDTTENKETQDTGNDTATQGADGTGDDKPATGDEPEGEAEGPGEVPEEPKGTGEAGMPNTDTGTDTGDDTGGEGEGEFGMPDSEDGEAGDTEEGGEGEQAKSEAEERRDEARAKKAEADARKAEAEAKRAEANAKKEEARAKQEREDAGIKGSLKKAIERDKKEADEKWKNKKEGSEETGEVEPNEQDAKANEPGDEEEVDNRTPEEKIQEANEREESAKKEQEEAEERKAATEDYKKPKRIVWRFE